MAGSGCKIIQFDPGMIKKLSLFILWSFWSKICKCLLFFQLQRFNSQHQYWWSEEENTGDGSDWWWWGLSDGSISTWLEVCREKEPTEPVWTSWNQTIRNTTEETETHFTTRNQWSPSKIFTLLFFFCFSGSMIPEVILQY